MGAILAVGLLLIAAPMTRVAPRPTALTTEHARYQEQATAERPEYRPAA